MVTSAKDETRRGNMGVWTAIGVGIGAATGNLAVLTAVGTAVGVAVGAALSRK